ncbi:alcohol dehydrogenase family protein [Pseudonocardia eucalypti]|uniref:Alcohol dehydrogenase family protein n=1 Tax=Pseudonocardia eucalypti TaxID=648755 RepID=A0ABP9R3G8_9PSEU|nr:threonine dehydrogenase-like Zn-dependent dehydrogenase [Pseudonocardia eucalypti]
MRGVTYRGPSSVEVRSVPDAALPDEHGAVVAVDLAGICGSDLHIYAGHGFSPDTGYCLGHEAVGRVVELGRAVTGLAVGDRVLVAASVGCAFCAECRRGRVSRCAAPPVAAGTVACYGLSHALPGSQAEAVAVPHAATNLIPVPDGLSDEDAVVLTDNAPTAWYGARRARIQPGDSVVVVGLGPVGLMCIQAAYALGAARVFGMDKVPDRRDRAAAMGAEPVAPPEGPDPDRGSAAKAGKEAKAAIRAATGGGADVALEAVGADASIDLAIGAVRTGGRVSVVGVSQNKAFPLHMPAAQVRELEFAIGLCSVQYELPTLLALTAAGRLRPAEVVTHRLPLSEAAEGYRLMSTRSAGVSKVVLTP